MKIISSSLHSTCLTRPNAWMHLLCFFITGLLLSLSCTGEPAINVRNHNVSSPNANSEAVVATPASEAPTPAVSQNWPKHTLRILVGFPAGSTPDQIARALAEPLEKELGQSVIVENHVGVSGNLAAQLLSRAKDDHTLGLLINSNFTTSKALYPQMGFDPLKDLRGVCLIAISPLVLIAPINLPSGLEFFKAAQTAADKWNYGSVGIGSMAHLGIEAIKASNPGFKPTHIPYSGNPAVLSALLSGEIQMALVPIGVAEPMIQAGKIKAIGITGGRSILAPQIVPLSLLGIRGFAAELQVWDALVGPSSLSSQASMRLEGAIKQIAQDSALRDQLLHQGWLFKGSGAHALEGKIQSEYPQTQSLIERLNLRINP